jgi:hypothetical protein
MRSRLRLFTGVDESSVAVQEPPVTIKVGQLAKILADAHRSQRTWLKDFSDDEVQISADLYEVMTSYWNLRPSA